MKANSKRMIVTGREGQVVRSLQEHGNGDGRFDVVMLGRPELDLSRPDDIGTALRAVRPDVIVSAAAYTSVDLAEANEDLATVINTVAAGEIARTAAALGVPVIHLSTDYVFDGSKAEPYTECDLVGPVGAYGRSKLGGEIAVAAALPNHVILRTAWVYSPFGKNFLKTMLRVAEAKDHLNVVDDQIGNPTSALDIAAGVFAVATNLLTEDAAELRGIFHMAGSGDASWADFATEIFAVAARIGVPSAQVDRISSSQYPTPAKRPANSRLDCQLLETRHGIRLPDWKKSTATVVERLAQI